MSLIKHGRTRDFIEQMEGLINLCSAKHIRVIPGSRPCTNGVDTIELPWISEEATEEDFLSFFCYAAHEQAHFYGKSDVKKMNELADKHKPRRQMYFSCINTMDDIRCENIQEKEYPGLKQYRISEYDMMLDKSFKETFSKATTAKIGEFIFALQCYIIYKNRFKQLGVPADLCPSTELSKAYTKYISGIEGLVLSQESPSDSLDLADVFFNSIRDLIEEEVDKKETGKGEKSKEKGESEKEEGSEEGESDDSEEGESSDSKGEDSDDSDDSEKSDEESEGTEGSAGEGTEGEAGEPDKSSSPKAKEETPEEKAERKAKEAEEKKKREEERKRKIEEALDKAEDEMGTITDEITKHIMEVSDATEAPYMVDAGVKDIIEYNREGSQLEADNIKAEGLKILGVSGSQLTRLFVGNSRPRPVRNQRRGRFDMRTFISDPMDRRFDVYSDTLAATVDKAAVSIMMDNSGSMSHVIYKAYTILSGLMHHLCRANIPTEVVGFTTEGTAYGPTRDCPVRLTIVKKFEDPYDGKAMRRCVVPPRLEQNAEVDCLRFMVPRLWKRPEGKKILFVVGDGQPCIGSGVLNEKLSKAYDVYLKLCRELGIIVFGFGIGCDLSQFFKDDFISVTDKTMGPAIVKKLTEVLNRKKRA